MQETTAAPNRPQGQNPQNEDAKKQPGTVTPTPEKPNDPAKPADGVGTDRR